MTTISCAPGTVQGMTGIGSCSRSRRTSSGSISTALGCARDRLFWTHSAARAQRLLNAKSWGLKASASRQILWPVSPARSKLIGRSIQRDFSTTPVRWRRRPLRGFRPKALKTNLSPHYSESLVDNCQHCFHYRRKLPSFCYHNQSALFPFTRRWPSFPHWMSETIGDSLATKGWRWQRPFGLG